MIAAADHPIAATGRSVEELEGAMPADIVEGTHPTFGVAQDDRALCRAGRSGDSRPDSATRRHGPRAASSRRNKRSFSSARNSAFS